MPISFKAATFEATHVLLGLSGPSSSGKTYSALRVARGLSPDKPIAVIDTEKGRAAHYAREFKFLHGLLEPPFRPTAYRDAVESAIGVGAGCIVVDSMSHEHEGVGGLLDWHDEKLTQMAGNEAWKREKMTFSAWIEPKADHNRMVNYLTSLPVHLIFCFRAKDKLALIKNDRGKMEPTPVGWTPITPDRFDYELTCNLVLPPMSGGVPDLTAPATKLSHIFADIFKAGEQLTEAHGAKLREWASGGAKMSVSQRLDVLQGVLDRAQTTKDVDAIISSEGVKRAQSELKNGDLTRLNKMIFEALKRAAGQSQPTDEAADDAAERELEGAEA